VQRGCDVAVRPAGEADETAIASLRRAIRPTQVDRRAVPDRPDEPQRVLVAEIEGVVVGMVAMGSGCVGPAFGVTALEVTEVHVRGGYEQCGVGGVLVAAATSEAERLGCDHLLLNLPAHGRQTGLPNRLRLATGRRRLAPISTLRRRLGMEPTLRPSELVRRRAVMRGVERLPQPVVRRG
jgi:N-acetylglutamate synthase-like GNAT family acetyltransferase